MYFHGFSQHFIIRQFIKKVRSKAIIGFFEFIHMFVYSYFTSFKIFGFSWLPRVYFSDVVFRVSIDKSKTSRVNCNENIAFIFESFIKGESLTTMVIGENSIVTVYNTFTIGDGCRISVGNDSALYLGGENNHQSSGITCDTKIICNKQISIGCGTIISWGCYITDTNNHFINGVLLSSPIVIGDNVWISEGVTVVPGAEIGNNSVVGAKSFVNKKFSHSVLLAGCPAKVKKENVRWQR